MKFFAIAIAKAIFPLFLFLLTWVPQSSAQQEISVAYCSDCIPFQYTNQQGNPAGTVIEFWELWSEETGVSIEFIAAPWAETLRLVDEGEADAHAGLFFNDERDRYLDYGSVLQSTNSQVFFHEELPTIQSINELAAYRVGVLSGDFIEGFLNDAAPDAALVGMQSYGEILDALNDRRLRAFAADTETALYYLREHGLEDQFPLTSSLLLYQDEWRVAVGEGKTELLSVIDAGFARIDPEEQHRIRQSTAPDVESDSLGGLLTAAERRWLAEHRTLRMGVDPAWPPIDYLDENGIHLGFSADVIRLLGQRLDLSIETVPNRTWPEVLEGVEERSIDIISICADTAERRSYLRFTRPVLSIPWVIVTQNGFRPIRDLRDLIESRIAMSEGHAVVDMARAEVPGLQIQEIPSPLEGLRLVESGGADAYVGNLGVVAQLMRENALDGLRIAAETGLPNQQLSICVRSDWPELVQILNKAIANLPPDTLRTIRNRWIPFTLNDIIVPREEHLPSNLWLVGGAILIGLIVLVTAARLWMKSGDGSNLVLHFGSGRFRAMVLAILVLFIALSFLLGWFALQHSKNAISATVQNNIQTILNTTVERLREWSAYRTLLLEDFSRDPGLRAMTEELLRVRPDAESLLTSRALGETRRYFQLKADSFGSLGFFIIDRDGISIGSARDSNIGTTNLIASQRPELLQRVFEGDTVFIPPIESDVGPTGADSGSSTATMFFAAPIRNREGEVVAALAQRIDPGDDFTRVLQFGRIGESGESYAFDRQGLLLSESRFNETLRDIGLIGADQSSMLNVQIRDPGGSLVDGHQPELALTDRPLTRMATFATRNQPGFDMVGYRDYRGVQVLGAWTWDRDLDLGIATEIDLSEAMSSYYTVRATTFGVLGITLLFSVGAVVFMLVLGERANVALRAAKDNLEQRVADRTREVIESQERIQSLIELSPFGFALVRNDGSVSITNPAYRDMVGSSDDAVPVGPLSLLAEQSLRKEVLSDLMEDSVLNPIETEFKRDDGSLFWGSLTGRLIDYGGTPAIMFFLRDVTVRKDAELKLVQQEKQTSAVLQSMSEGLFVLSSDGIYELLNEKYLTFLSDLGSPPDLAVVGQPIMPVLRDAARRGLYGEGDADTLAVQRLNGLLSDDSVNVEFETQAGRWYELRKVAREGGGSIVVSSDITERVQSQIEISRKSAQLGSVLSSMSGGLFVVDKDGVLELMNENHLQFVEDLGTPRELCVIGGPILPVLTDIAKRGYYGPGDPEQLAKVRLEGLLSDQPSTLELKTEIGRWYELRKVHRDGGGAITLSTDITERVESQNEITQKGAQLSSTLSSMSDGIFVMDQDGNLEMINEKYLNFIRDLGTPTELAAIGNPIYPLLLDAAEQGYYGEGDPTALAQSRLANLFSDASVNIELETGAGTWYELRKVPREEGGAIIVSSDITERVLNQREIEDAFGVINDSIEYASRIQRSVLPGDYLLQSIAEDSFIAWEPRDRVGGDFYHFAMWGNGMVVIVGDCTGHGVPGAFMTLIASSAIDRALTEVPPGQAGYALSRIHQLVQLKLGQHGLSSESDDGLELGLCFIDLDFGHLLYAGARFSLFKVLDGAVDEIKGDKRGVGYREVEHTFRFGQTEVPLDERATFYLTTDGVIDQVGGERRRSFGKKRFKQLLLDLQDAPLEGQGATIVETLNEFAGEESRRDDVCVIGFRPSTS